MLNCKEVTEVCSRACERKLFLHERVSLRIHLMMCRDCSNFNRQMQSMRTIMQGYAKGLAVSTTDEETGAG